MQKATRAIASRKGLLCFLFLYLLLMLLCCAVADKAPYYSNHIKTSEVFVLFVTVLILYFLAAKDLQHAKSAALCVLCFALPLYVSIDRLTVFLSTDEPRAINEQAKLIDDILRHWNFGNARTNYIIMGTFSRLLPTFLRSIPDLSVYQIFKLAHWFAGIMIIYVIARIVSTHFFSLHRRTQRAFSFFIVFLSLLLLPTVLTTLKNYNYDMFSLLFGLLGFVITLVAMQTRSKKRFFQAFTALFLAAQEKELASPLCYVAMALHVFVSLQASSRKAFLPAVRTAFRQAVCAYGYFVLLSFSSAIYLGILRDGAFPVINLENTLSPLISALVFLTRIVPVSSAPWIIAVAASVLVIFMVALAGGVLHLLSLLHPTQRMRMGLRTILAAIPCILLLAGVVATYAVPYTTVVPISLWDNASLHHGVMNDYVYYIEASTKAGSFLKMVAAEYSVFAQNLTTPILLCALLAFLAIVRQRTSPLLAIAWCIASLFPLAYTALGITPLPRYINLYIGIFALCTVLICMQFLLSSLQWKKRSVWACLLAGVMLAEIQFFGPAYAGTFVALWNVQPYPAYVQEGVLYHSLVGGWGEYTALAGDRITQYLHANNLPTDDVNIFTDYKGTWLTNQDAIPITLFPTYYEIVPDYASRGYDEKVGLFEVFSFRPEDYYVFTRWSTIRNLSRIPFPPSDIEPLLTITHRGIPCCWIYRGNQLEKHILSQNNMLPSGYERPENATLGGK